MSDHQSERRVDLLAREFALNINSLTTRQLLDHLDMRVDAFINAFRRAGIRGALFLDSGVLCSRVDREAQFIF